MSVRGDSCNGSRTGARKRRELRDRFANAGMTKDAPRCGGVLQFGTLGFHRFLVAAGRSLLNCQVGIDKIVDTLRRDVQYTVEAVACTLRA